MFFLGSFCICFLGEDPVSVHGSLVLISSNGTGIRLAIFSYKYELQVWLLWWPGSRSTRTGWWSPPTSCTARARTRRSRRRSSPRLARTTMCGCWALVKIFRYRNWSCGLSEPMLRIHGIFVWIRIRIRIRESMPLTNGSGSCYFRHWPSRCQQKLPGNLLKQFFLLITFWRYIYIIFQR